MDLNIVILTIAQGHQLFFDESDDEEDIRLEKTVAFAEETVPRFTDRQFKEHFRMSPTTFENLLQKLHSLSHKELRGGYPALSLEKQVMIALWCLANTESLRSVSGRFDISKSTCWSVLYRTCHGLLDLNRRFQIISWPSRQRAMEIMEAFQQINGLRGVIGCIDGSHIEILTPREHPNSYCNRKSFHSVLLQAVCDNKKMFTHVYAGEPGSIHDNRLFEKSDLYRDIQNGVVLFPNNSHIVGDLAYKLTDYLMVGFKDNGFLTNDEKKFNIRLSQIRVHIENAFALLKGRFRRLKCMENVRLDLISLLIVSACILHNICILYENGVDDLDIEAEQQEQWEPNNPDQFENVAAHNQGVAKRLWLMANLDE